MQTAPRALLAPEFIESIARFFRVDVQLVTSKLVSVLLVWVLAWVALQAVKLAARRIELAVDDGDDTVMTLAEKRGHTVAQLLRSVGRVVVVLLAAMLTLNQFINIGPILAGAGILGLAVSFGAQSLVKDIITGFFLLVDNSIAVGDVVEIAGKSGAVERVNLRVVQLRALDGSLHIVPNGQITVVSNMTRGWSRAVVDVGVAYETDLDRALAVVKNEVERFAADGAWKARLDGAPEVLGVQTLGDHGVTLRVLLRTLP
ncbi:MAG TPA: mechanosensitive ion channel family protein, partial [Gemmatimonadales bacterium]|nr:mechanosensitive ion channel family protein [Gemmatimonadales bacterium]